MPARELRLLTAALEGRVPPDQDWPRVIEAANRGWLGPALYLALDRSAVLPHVPAPVREYLSLLHERNCERNRRLKTQLVEAVATLNASGIRPILLKGAVNLFTAEGDTLGERMIGDIDLSIDPAELPRARAALLPLGYTDAASERELARPCDVGIVELHLGPSARSARYLAGDLRPSCRPMELDGAVALVPSATARALHLIVHDMIKQGDYWRLRMDLRHVKDLADLAKSPEGVNWQELAAILSDRTGRRALQVQVQAVNDLFGVRIDGPHLHSRTAKLIHLARLAAISHSSVASPFKAAGNFSWGVHRFANDRAWEGIGDLLRRTGRVFVARPRGSRI